MVSHSAAVEEVVVREGVALSGNSRSVGRFPDHTMPANHLWAMLGAVRVRSIGVLGTQ